MPIPCGFRARRGIATPAGAAPIFIDDSSKQNSPTICFLIPLIAYSLNQSFSMYILIVVPFSRGTQIIQIESLYLINIGKVIGDTE
jgi:hypothetical protein